MSKHAKKLKRKQEWDQAQLGERWGQIDIERNSGDAWLTWDYCVRLFEAGCVRSTRVRVEIPLPSGGPWLYIEGDAIIEGKETEVSWVDAEARFGARTRLELLKTYREEICANTQQGLLNLRAAAATRKPLKVIALITESK